MKSIVLWSLLLAATVSASGMFVREQTKQVPIDRLFTNLERRASRETNNFRLTYQLARLHALAYATNSETMPVSDRDEMIQFASPGSDTGVPRTVTRSTNQQERAVALRHLTNAITQYKRAIAQLRRSRNQNEQQSYVVPFHLGLAWCLDQAGQREEALDAYRRTLQMAWKIEVTGDFKLEEWLNDAWKDVQSGRNPIHPRRRGFLGPGPSFSAETIGYLLKLLDPVKDASEMARLKEDQKTLGTMGRAVTPIVVPLEMNLPFDHLIDPNGAVAFDLDGTALPRKWNWITPKAAWLVYDHEGTGRITSALQMFGNVTFWIFWRDGYEALSSLDDNDDGVLRGEELRGLALWHDRNQNGISEPGEVQAVAKFGIAEINCRADSDERGVLRSSRGAIFDDGRSTPTYDWITPGQPLQPDLN